MLFITYYIHAFIATIKYSKYKSISYAKLTLTSYQQHHHDGHHYQHLHEQ
jgi:hypothetical protein